jgi:hypothetical protein
VYLSRAPTSNHPAIAAVKQKATIVDWRFSTENLATFDNNVAKTATDSADLPHDPIVSLRQLAYRHSQTLAR